MVNLQSVPSLFRCLYLEIGEVSVICKMGAKTRMLFNTTVQEKWFISLDVNKVSSGEKICSVEWNKNFHFLQKPNQNYHQVNQSLNLKLDSVKLDSHHGSTSLQFPINFLLMTTFWQKRNLQQEAAKINLTLDKKSQHPKAINRVSSGPSKSTIFWLDPSLKSHPLKSLILSDPYIATRNSWPEI